MQTITTTAKTPQASSATTRPLHHLLTLDLFLLILSRSLFHPFICFLIPLCLLAIHHPPTSPPVLNSFYWACLVTVYHTLAVWNHRLAYGWPRKVDLEEEVVLVAGGGGSSGGGLGRLLVEVYAMKGVKGVAVLDVQVPAEGPEREEWEEMGVRWYRCDVGRREEVEKVREEIHKEFDTHPTILMNCIAAPVTTQPITSLSTDQFTSTVTANLTSHFNLLSVFLPDIITAAKASSAGSKNNKNNKNNKNKAPSDASSNSNPKAKGGTILTTSSILSHLPPANLSPYTTSKSGLSTLHTSLVAEISKLNLSNTIKTILLEPGQINTTLFAPTNHNNNHNNNNNTNPSDPSTTQNQNQKQQPPNPILDPTLTTSSPLARFFAPVLETRDVVRAVEVLIDQGEGGVVRLPAYASLLVGSGLWGVLPQGVKRLGRWVSGVDRVVL